MTDGSTIRRLWPGAAGTPLDDDALAELYGRSADAKLRVNFVASLDGAADLGGYSAGLSGVADKRVFGMLRMLCDALLVGAGTLRRERYRALRLDGRRRAWRRDRGLAEYPTLVVVSGRLDLDPEQAAFADAPVRPLVVTSATARAPTGLAAVADVIRIGHDGTDLPEAVAWLHRRGHRQLLCEGGPGLFGTLTAADLVDEVCLTVAPLLVGPGAGRITAGPAGPTRGMAIRHVLAADDGSLMLRYHRD